MQNGNQSSGHTLTLTGRTNAVITGVEDVDCFNEQVVVLSTTLGTMTISGSGLNISHLNQEEGRLVVDGEFDAIEYSGKTRASKGGFLGRILH